ncbi:hypothetical protein [Streptomyces sp. NPDC058701]|uniref:hypothetical protein n=1 Tax=Streptomyces sp. NPDC058701 TaxID=3346608 RepID=UPI00365729F7
MTLHLLVQEGDEFYMANPPLGSDGAIIRIAENREPEALNTGKVWVVTVGEDGKGRRRRLLET